MQNARQITVYDPKTKQFSFIDTCFGTHHLNFAEDANNTLWLSNNSQGNLALVGWINTKMYWETGDQAKSQGWTPLIVDTNGNGKRDEGYNEPGKPGDPAKDTRIPFGMYGISWSPLDGSLWGSNLAHPGYLIRLDPGPNPPETALAELYRIPLPGYGIRGLDIDRNGVVWVAARQRPHREASTAANARVRSMDRAPSSATNVPRAGPSIRSPARASRAMRAPPRIPITCGSTSTTSSGSAPTPRSPPATSRNSLHALVGGRIIELRVPYPMGFFAKGLDGRIDDPNAGWKGRGLWVTSGNRTPAHIEGIDAPVAGAPGGTTATLSSPMVVNFQLRPDPLAH